MTFLSDQQSVILSEGICPFCKKEVGPVSCRLWKCPGCGQQFELVRVDVDPDSTTERNNARD